MKIESTCEDKLTEIMNRRTIKMDIPRNIVQICNSTFQGNKSIKKVSLHSQLQLLDVFCFKGCTNLETVYIPSDSYLYRVPESCFEDCEHLKNISLPKSLVSIDANAFKNCYNIPVLTIPKEVNEVSATAFVNWSENQELVLHKEYGEFEDCKAKITRLYEESKLQDALIQDKNDGNRYFAVTCKCGHVRKKYYIPITYAVLAKNRKEAAAIARDIPRVKHNHPDAILENVEISYIDFLEQKKINQNDPYLNAHSRKEQEDIFHFIKDRLIPEPLYVPHNLNKGKRKQSYFRNSKGHIKKVVET